MPVVDVCAREVLHVDFPPHYKPRGPNGGAPVLSNGTTEIPPLATDSLARSGRERIPPPLAPFDFLPDLIARSDATYAQTVQAQLTFSDSDHGCLCIRGIDYACTS